MSARQAAIDAIETSLGSMANMHQLPAEALATFAVDALTTETLLMVAMERMREPMPKSLDAYKALDREEKRLLATAWDVVHRVEAYVRGRVPA